MEAENEASHRAFPDAEWTVRHPELDAALTAAIRAPVVDERFDEQVWASIRAHEARTVDAVEPLRMRLGTPWWLDSLNVIAIAATMVIVAFALLAGTSGTGAESVALASALEPRSESLRSFTLIASAAVFWFGVRQAPAVRALFRAGL